mmetsp:Transcript_141423/g.200301  ORF Transcript_141423/g.200301 Transcript_141423/m.200301 type:complete len:103 (+) Transcript_141423:161-469(+)
MSEQNKDAEQAAATSAEEKNAEAKIAQLEAHLTEDPNMTPEQREAEIKKARIAMMRKIRSPATPYNSVEDFSKSLPGKEKKDQLNADSLNAKLAGLDDNSNK